LEEKQVQKIELQAESREVLGKRNKNLRQQGITPVHIYGHGIDSLALQCDSLKLERVLAVAEENRIITLKIKKDKNERPVLTREVQRDAMNGKLIHVDFYQVRMGEKVEVQIPVVLIGEAPALSIKENSLLQGLHELAVECLPDKIPVHIEVDISVLAEAGQAIRVKDIKANPDVTIITDADTMVANIIVRAKEKVEEKKPEAEAEAAPGAEAAAEGEKPKAEAAPKDSKQKESK
jgi:large subunit ribosomal protein L25